MNTLFKSFSHQFARGFLIQSNQTLLLTNSGGQDSTILSFLILLLQKQHKYNVLIVYCNHLWQIASIQLIVQLSRVHFSSNNTLIVPVITNVCPTENQARAWRYNVINRLSCFTTSQYSIMGHTGTDQIESFLLHILRGTGSLGSTTLKLERINYLKKFICFNNKKELLIKQNYKTSSNKYIGSIIWRPLCKFNRFEIYHFYNILKLPIWTDKTNLNLKYRRNRIRYQLLPYLRFYLNPNVDLALNRYIQNLSYETTYLKKLTNKLLQQNAFYNFRNSIIFFNYSQFSKYPYILQKLILIQICNNLKLPQVTNKVINNILKLICLIKKDVANKSPNNQPKLFYITNNMGIGLFNQFIFICQLNYFNGSDGI